MGGALRSLAQRKATMPRNARSSGASGLSAEGEIMLPLYQRTQARTELMAPSGQVFTTADLHFFFGLSFWQIIAHRDGEETNDNCLAALELPVALNANSKRGVVSWVTNHVFAREIRL